MSVYFIARGTIVDQAMHDGYVAGALPTLPADCTVLSVDFATQTLEGEAQPPRTVMLEFASEDSFRAWYDSPEYRAILPQRLNSVDGTAVLCAGFVPPAG